MKIEPTFYYYRFKASVDLDLAVSIFNVAMDCQESDRVRHCVQDFRRKLEELNRSAEQQCGSHVAAGVENIVKGVCKLVLLNNMP